MKQLREPKRVFLYIGLSLLVTALMLKWLGIVVCCFGILFSIAIFFKTLFLVSIFIAKGFKSSLWLYLVLAGVVMILISMFFKTVFPISTLRNTLFYGAIMLKVSGLILMLVCNTKKNGR